MPFIDISKPIDENLPVWPGDPKVRLDWLGQVDTGSESNITMIHMCAHSGTHVDAPVHFLKDGKSIDQLNLEKLIGEASIIEISEDVDVITSEVLAACNLPRTSRILFKTRNSKVWSKRAIQFSKDYVALDGSGAQWLVDYGIEVAGIDYLSIASFDDTQTPHSILLSAEVIVIEGLDLTMVEPGEYRLICLPLNIKGRDGAPARVLLETLE